MSEKPEDFCPDGACTEPTPCRGCGNRRGFLKGMAGAALGVAGFFGYKVWDRGHMRQMNQEEAEEFITTFDLDGDHPAEMLDVIRRGDTKYLMEHTRVWQPGALAASAGYCYYIEGCISTQACPQYRNWHRCKCCTPSHGCVYGVIVYGKCCPECYCYQYAGYPCNV